MFYIGMRVKVLLNSEWIHGTIIAQRYAPEYDYNIWYVEFPGLLIQLAEDVLTPA